MTTDRKCFIEEIPDETLVIGKYKVELLDPATNTFIPGGNGIGMHVEVKDPDEKLVLSKLYTSEGRFSFTSHRVHLDIDIGEHAVDYGQISAREKLTELQLRVRQLLDQVEQITKEQNYQRYREERFRATSESTNQRVLWWSIAQLAILVLTGVWQMRHLKSFFEAKKLV
ncbi:unnamed protein product [Didymodactylos carnosus]|uniref:GOLD domain-containing protein n=1 Tax=Didymodactylos carnosus TaxID=1234261 RepID=A0A813QHX1_9BILA|nr:unnamed protein product [Didymodactylos carnosus]CAF0768171.1 unnamed protein product [Didymodactylos carnosus]CAF3501987.1 unnamed protein product [Didymodactylos carnosus]CAF3549985.1 unnamed protein product [Didymodactylos carnosus]